MSENTYPKQVCFYHIRDLRRIRKSLSLDLAKQIAVAVVSSKLDYCREYVIYGSKIHIESG